MILNSLNNQFVIQFSKNMFYSEVRKKWEPVVRRLKLPYESIEDFINASVQSINFPSVELPIVEQQQQQYKIAYRGGKELEAVLDKNLTLTFKLSEGFISYWILFEQLEMFVAYGDSIPFWPPMYVSFLDHHGFELVAFTFHKIVPTNLSQFEITYAQTAAEFNTFTMNLRYNRYTIKRRIEEDITSNI
jgi:hypothetical protein